MKIIYNDILPPKGFAAINLFGMLFARRASYPLSRVMINHERIHTKQMKYMLYVFFYLWYGIEWVIRVIQYRNAMEAYYNISFEREAYANQYDLEYPKKRKAYAWINYLRKKRP